ncbi:peptidoglycan recognition protein 5 isoform X2 [Pleuronectes platessa]|uniref:peptidoglycan recognition protein 5 isoform X2 n=1 Tax=Pleuronectes platessa TaxID=8262 RepID=UPI00232A495A|nr:peptidoglycan recognition protein 5 isoform X2 [Pleuronectes platessa]
MEQNVKIVSRAQWQAAPPKQRERLKSLARRVVIHHTATPSCRGLKKCKEQIFSIQRGHMTERGFSDIGYNFLVEGGGIVFEGRGWGVVGAHSKGNNHDSLGIAFIGNFNRHRDLGDTECPGENLYSALPNLRGTT